MSINDNHEPETELDEIEDTEGHIYVPKEERDGAVPGGPQRRTLLGEAEEDSRRLL